MDAGHTRQEFAMNIRKFVFILAAACFAGSASLVFAEDNVLEQARQKYDRNRAGANEDQSRATELVRDNIDSGAETPVRNEPAPAAADTPAASTDETITSTVTTGDKTVTVEVQVTVKKEKAAKAAPAKPETEAKAAEGHRRFFVFQFVPGLPRVNRADVATFALSPVVSSVGAVDGVQFGLFLAQADRLTGAQLSAIGNLAGDVEGVQVSSLFNIGGKVEGLQAAALFDISSSLRGVQASGLFNISGNTEGVQAAGLFNIAGDLQGVQAAGLFNVAGDLQGVQAAGLLNVAKKVKGVQVGVVNIAEDVDGLAIGLINFTKNGIHEITAWYESNNMVNFAILNGGRHFYSIVQGGALATDYFNNTNSLTGGLGFGFRLGAASGNGFYFQSDLSARALLDLDGAVATSADSSIAERLRSSGWRHVRDNVSYNFSFANPVVSVFPSLRANVGLNLFSTVGIFLGAVVDFEAPGWWSIPDFYKSPANITGAINNQPYGAYAKWFAGVSVF
jgi:hypothetical protein